MSGTRTVQTDQFRFQLKNRLFREPLIALQMQFRVDENVGYITERWERKYSFWRDVQVEDLTTMNITTLLKPRDPDSLPICFQPKRKLGGWSLILMVCDGAYQQGQWRPAKLQDLMIKDGKITGGLGLVRR